MKETRSTNPEPTLQDVIETMQIGFGHIELRFEGIEKKLASGFKGVWDEMKELTRRVGNLESGVCDVDEHLYALATAFDKDAVTLLDHEHRIVRLEKTVPA